jgi:hypothetical protein
MMPVANMRSATPPRTSARRSLSDIHEGWLVEVKMNRSGSGDESANPFASRRANVTENVAGEGDGLGGRRFVVGLYLALVVVSGVMGALFTVAVDDPDPPALFFLVELPSTTVGFALYGALTIAVVLGLPLALVVAVSAAVDDVDAVGRADRDE